MTSKANAVSQWGLTFWAAAVLGTAAVGAAAKAPASGEAHRVVALSALPPEARQTHQLIVAGGPFPFAKDGTTFFNRERQLPARPRGHYREYTVKTPGSRDRGARRIVCGGQAVSTPEVCFYTADHYASFSRIAP
jgi:ribonuclease T1